ncbi:hypothetical protein HK103_006326 [Boothiomyces macroporosus]|uniref:UspA domain-containing protein n=1 Tax=Boothiomyces macroporosus TaxID=261099 RepID=A0AAD5UGY7_9FUNG|nr:hypothetical protein HK103_006326 [Boothiomyces macroporosus]
MVNKKLPPGDYEALPLCTIIGEQKKAQIEMLIEVGKFFQAKDIHVDAIAVNGDARQEIERVIENDSPDLVIIGSRGLGAVSRVLLGSVSEHVIHHSPTTILDLGFTKRVSFNYELLNLVTLDLTGNQLEYFDASSYPSLQYLFLARNKLNSIKLKKLELLNISFNKIKELKEIDIAHLSANNNQISSISIINCKYLDLSNNKLGEFNQSIELDYVDLSGNPLKGLQIHPKTKYITDIVKSNSQETLNEEPVKVDVEKVKRTIHPNIYSYFCSRNHFGQYESRIKDLLPHLSIEILDFVETCLINKILCTKQTIYKINVIEESRRVLEDNGYRLERLKQVLEMYFMDKCKIEEYLNDHELVIDKHFLSKLVSKNKA